jgi:hypothetical protein
MSAAISVRFCQCGLFIPSQPVGFQPAHHNSVKSFWFRRLGRGDRSTNTPRTRIAACRSLCVRITATASMSDPRVEVEKPPGGFNRR